MKFKLRVINKKWLEFSTYRKNYQMNIVYWGGLQFSSSKIYA